MIKNFILIYYKKNDLDLDVCDHFTKNIYLQSQINIFCKMIKQIKYHYPHSFIHVITNEDICKEFNVIIHKKDIKNNHCSKFLIYNLLDEPAMYLDCDIILTRRFTSSELDTIYPIKFFRKNGKYDFSKLSYSFKENIDAYNAGVVWVKNPNKSIVQDLTFIEDTFLNNKEFIKKNGFWPYNDEYSISYYLNSKKWKFEESETVNIVPENKNGFTQSIHYTGLYNKKIFLKDYFKYYPLFV